MNYKIITLLIALSLNIWGAIKPLPFYKKKYSLGTLSLIILFILFIFQILDFESFKHGIIGGSQIQPWKIIIIFFTVAYCSISTDITGIFDVIAHRVILLSSGDTIKLFTFFYLLASFLTVFTSNDVVILTLTPIIFYLKKYTNLNIIPFLFAEFFAANTLSMLFMIGNPTNIILSDALNLSFLEYFKVMFFPTVIASILTYILLLFYFKKDLTSSFSKKQTESMLPHNYINIGVSALLMSFMLYTLILSDFLEIEIWEITTLFFLLFVIQDSIISIYTYNKNKLKNKLSLPLKDIQIKKVFNAMPWSIAPFIFLLFIIIGEISQFDIFISITNYIYSLCTNIFSSIFSMGISSFLLANIVNNQPMSIFFSNILINNPENFSSQFLNAAGYAVIIASNLSANLTPIGALAGIMWLKILKNKNLNISFLQFFKVGIIITPIVFIVSLLILAIEMY